MKEIFFYKRASNFPINCIFVGLFLFIVGFLWYSFSLIEDYLELYHGYSSQGTVPYEIILMNLRSFGLIFIVFGIALSLYSFRNGIRIRSIDKIYQIMIILGFIAAFIGELIYTVWYYIIWSAFIDNQIGTSEFNESYFFANVFYLAYMLGLLILFVMICLLIIDILKRKNIERVIEVRSADNQGPLDNF
jgi:hypothetical protein